MTVFSVINIVNPTAEKSIKTQNTTNNPETRKTKYYILIGRMKCKQWLQLNK